MLKAYPEKFNIKRWKWNGFSAQQVPRKKKRSKNSLHLNYEIAGGFPSSQNANKKKVPKNVRMLLAQEWDKEHISGLFHTIHYNFAVDWTESFKYKKVESLKRKDKRYFIKSEYCAKTQEYHARFLCTKNFFFYILKIWFFVFLFFASPTLFYFFFRFIL